MGVLSQIPWKSKFRGIEWISRPKLINGDMCPFNTYPSPLSYAYSNVGLSAHFVPVSSVTGGKQMIPILNALNVNIAVFGNHDFGKF